MGTLRLAVTEENDALDNTVGNATHVSLHTADPGATGASEANGNGYARQAVTFSIASSGETDNDAKLEWTASGGTLGGAAVTHYGLWDAATAGNFIGGGSLSQSRTIADGDKLEIAAGALTLSVADS